MNLFLKFILVVVFIASDQAGCQRLVRRRSTTTKPIVSDDCTKFRQMCSDLCSKNVENDQCWGSPRYIQCVCNDGTIHRIPDYPCKHPECPKIIVKEGTTGTRKKPINRIRRPIRNRSRKPIQRSTQKPSTTTQPDQTD